MQRLLRGALIQPKPAQEPAESATNEEAEADEVIPAKDTMAGTLVSEIVISLARERVGFRTATGWIFGRVGTDLKAGTYELKPDVAGQKWVIDKPAVPEGFRFVVSLDNAFVWTLAYPSTLLLTVGAGLPSEPKTWRDAVDVEGKLRDPLWLYEGVPAELTPKPVTGVDDFESVHYDVDYKSEGGHLSKWVVANYRDNTTREFRVDEIGEQTPRLWTAKNDALKAMDDYNALFILGSFQTVFFVITINPFVAPVGGKRPTYTATRRQVPKSQRAPKGQQRPAPNEEALTPAPESKPSAPQKGAAPTQEPVGIPRDTTLTTPGAKPHPEARPLGKPTKISLNDDREVVRSLTRENESADTVTKAGYRCEQNPPKPSGSQKKPDYRIEGRYFDNFAPKTKNPRSIWTTIKGKIDAQQTRRIVLNLDDSKVDLVALDKQLRDYPIEGLEEILMVQTGSVKRIWP